MSEGRSPPSPPTSIPAHETQTPQGGWIWRSSSTTEWSELSTEKAAGWRSLDPSSTVSFRRLTRSAGAEPVTKENRVTRMYPSTNFLSTKRSSCCARQDSRFVLHPGRSIHPHLPPDLDAIASSAALKKDLDLIDTRGHLLSDRAAALFENRQHLGIVGEHIGGEAAQTVGPGVVHQSLL